MHIAVYGGSFNPLHIGHLAIMKHLVEVAGFDAVYLVVSPKNPLKEISCDSARDRYNAAVEAVSRHFVDTADQEVWNDQTMAARSNRVRVDDIELNMPPPHYSIRTLNALKEREPENDFTLIMGADNLAIIRNWKEYRTILKDFGVAVYPREGHNLVQIKQDLLNEDPAYKIQILEAPLVTVSSTEIREAIKRGKEISHYLM